MVICTRFLRLITKVNLTTICDRKKKLKKYAQELKCDFTDKFENIAKDRSIDLVTIASYDNFHYDQIISCLKQKNVFVEKPFCQTEKQYYEIKNL